MDTDSNQIHRLLSKSGNAAGSAAALFFVGDDWCYCKPASVANCSFSAG